MPKSYSKTKGAPLISSVMSNLTEAHAQRVPDWLQDHMLKNDVKLQLSRKEQTEAVYSLVVDVFGELNMRMLAGLPAEKELKRAVKLIGALTDCKDPEALVYKFGCDVTGGLIRELGQLKPNSEPQPEPPSLRHPEPEDGDPDFEEKYTAFLRDVMADRPRLSS